MILIQNKPAPEITNYTQLMDGLLRIAKEASSLGKWQRYSQSGYLTKESQVKLYTLSINLIADGIRCGVKNPRLFTILSNDAKEYIYTKAVKPLLNNKVLFMDYCVKYLKMDIKNHSSKHSTSTIIWNYKKICREIFGKEDRKSKLLLLESIREMLITYRSVAAQTKTLFK